MDTTLNERAAVAALTRPKPLDLRGEVAALRDAMTALRVDVAALRNTLATKEPTL